MVLNNEGIRDLVCWVVDCEFWRERAAFVRATMIKEQTGESNEAWNVTAREGSAWQEVVSK